MKVAMNSGRPTIAEIDLKALTSNYRQLQKKIPRGTNILGVVKADAYGHGALPISLELERLGVHSLGVAISDEAIELRRGGVKTPILILGGVFTSDEVDRVLTYDLTPVVFEKTTLQRLSKAAERSRKKVRVHIKVDTGLGRLGVPVTHWLAFVKEMRRFPWIETEGLLSHFSMTDEDGGVFSRDQWAKFQKAVSVAEGVGVRFKYLHISNSGNLTAFPAFSGNLVRPGIMLYGSYPSPRFRDRIKLQPVMTLKTRIHFLKEVPPGTRVSYGGTYVTKRKSLIATLPIGYADGYDCHLANRGEVLVRGRRVPVVGKVCMDLIMVDVTRVPGVSPGDDVVLMGKQGKERITVEEIAEKVKTIPYEILCSVGKRVPRVYRGMAADRPETVQNRMRGGGIA
jgi:alanine racemase